MPASEQTRRLRQANSQPASQEQRLCAPSIVLQNHQALPAAPWPTVHGYKALFGVSLWGCKHVANCQQLPRSTSAPAGRRVQLLGAMIAHGVRSRLGIFRSPRTSHKFHRGRRPLRPSWVLLHARTSYLHQAQRRRPVLLQRLSQTCVVRFSRLK